MEMDYLIQNLSGQTYNGTNESRESITSEHFKYLGDFETPFYFNSEESAKEALELMIPTAGPLLVVKFYH